MDEKRYAVVSCHVERSLDNRVWHAFSRLQERAPHGIRIAALMRPADEDAGEDPELWVARAREAAARGPLGHHTHWGGPSQARPRGGEPAERVRREAAWVRETGLRPTLFCGGGWYLDRNVASAIAELGYADCTATAFVPSYLPSGAARAEADGPSRLKCGDRWLLELPTTHSLGMLLRALLRGTAGRPYVHVYFHDTDLLDVRRAAAVRVAFAALARTHDVIDLDKAAAIYREADVPAVRLAR